MSDRIEAPSVEMIERRFRSIPVMLSRPVITGGLGMLAMVRGFSWTAKGTDRLQQIRGPFIMASNHSSHADTAAIMGTLPSDIRRRSCVAAALDVFGPAQRAAGQPFKVIKRECLQVVVAAGFGAFAFDRHGPSLRSIRTAASLVRNGWNLLLYPEGTRSRDGQMEEFKSGVGVIAKKTGRPVVPVYVSGGSTMLRLPHAASPQPVVRREPHTRSGW